jgi:hypothetical protein
MMERLLGETAARSAGAAARNPVGELEVKVAALEARHSANT